MLLLRAGHILHQWDVGRVSMLGCPMSMRSFDVRITLPVSVVLMLTSGSYPEISKGFDL